MEENQFWISVWKIIATASCFILLIVGGCMTKQDLVKQELVKSGADPVAVKCLFADSSSIACAMAVQKKK